MVHHQPEQYYVVIHGKVIGDNPKSVVAERLSKVLKMTPESAERILARNTTRLRNPVPSALGQKLVTLVNHCGVECELITTDNTLNNSKKETMLSESTPSSAHDNVLNSSEEPSLTPANDGPTENTEAALPDPPSVPAALKETDSVFCRHCGSPVAATQKHCPSCGAPQSRGYAHRFTSLLSEIPTAISQSFIEHRNWVLAALGCITTLLIGGAAVNLVVLKETNDSPLQPSATIESRGTVLRNPALGESTAPTQAANSDNFLASSRNSDQSIETGFSAYKYLVSRNGGSKIKVPHTWKAGAAEHPKAIMNAGNPRQATYVVALEEKAGKYLENANLAGYSKRLLEHYQARLNAYNLTKPQRFSNQQGVQGLMQEFSAKVGGQDLRYLISTHLHGSAFYQVISWTMADTFPERKAYLTHIAKSIEFNGH